MLSLLQFAGDGAGRYQGLEAAAENTISFDTLPLSNLTAFVTKIEPGRHTRPRTRTAPPSRGRREHNR